jgi:hypothetical protein
VLVVMEIGSRRIIHTNVTTHPTAEWTIQQFRECIPAEHAWKHLIHDRDAFAWDGSQLLENAFDDAEVRRAVLEHRRRNAHEVHV